MAAHNVCGKGNEGREELAAHKLNARPSQGPTHHKAQHGAHA